MIEIVVYQTKAGKRPFEKWFKSINQPAKDKVRVAISRLEEGNTSNLKSVGGGVHEIKINFGPAYRVYLGREGDSLVVLLHGGTKKRQDEDIARAKELWADYLAEKKH